VHWKAGTGQLGLTQ